MLTAEEKKVIKLASESGKKVTGELRAKLLGTIKNTDLLTVNQSDYLCCDLGIDQPNRYKWTTFDNCRALGGRAADNSMCGH
jgi:hypothetical protein